MSINVKKKPLLLSFFELYFRLDTLKIAGSAVTTKGEDNKRGEMNPPCSITIIICLSQLV